MIREKYGIEFYFKISNDYMFMTFKKELTRGLLYLDFAQGGECTSTNLIWGCSTQGQTPYPFTY